MPPRPVDLEPHREWIISHVDGGFSLDYIRRHIPIEGPSVSERTLKRRLDAWGIRHPDLAADGERRRVRRGRRLGEAKEWIIDLYRDGFFLRTVQDEISRRLGLTIGERALRTLLHDEWGVVPSRDASNTPEVREFIVAQAEAGIRVPEIVQTLYDEFELRRTRKWIYQKLTDWGVSLPERRRLQMLGQAEKEAIKDFIRLTFFEARQKDEDLKEQLEAMGYDISVSDVTRLRKGMGLLRRHGRDEAEEHLDEIHEAMGSCPRAEILVPRLTKKLLPIFFKQEYNISVSRAMAWRFLHERFPEEMLNRVREVARRRGGFLCPGPNYIWSMDAYCKLSHWGIEVYACIDAYSRYIIWAHVGHTAQTQRSVCLQYLDTVRTLGYLPMVIRSDHGVETGMIAGAHYWLSAAAPEGRLLKPTRDDDGNVVWIYRENVEGRQVRHVVYPSPRDDVPHPVFGPQRQLEFKDCYSYGVSTKNQRIESWWQELNFHITGYWRQVFRRMESEQEWSEYRIADRIAFLYIFLPQVHWEIGKFIRMWNGHTIRAQRNRPHVVPGIPRHNYFGRDTATRINCAVAVERDSLARLEEALEFDRATVTTYLSGPMFALCETMMATLDMDAIPPRDPVRPLISEYRHLRSCLQRHEEQQVAPLLHLAEKPTGGWPALEEVVQGTGRSLADILGEEIEDGFDPGIDE